ncbi:MAG: RNA polymerase sigma factor RpoD/SigA [bacterium]|nr:RNA polymerase sigma factor RpoD/SigA [bacterium]
MRQLKIGNSITLRQPVLHTYLYEISKIKMISPEEEVSLAQKIKQGNTQALEKLITANLRFVVSVAKMYQHKGLSLCDLINEGNIGLIKAAHKFDLTFGFKFISYAVWWIRQAILQAIAEKSRLIRIPSNQVNTITGINKAINEFELQHQRRPSQQELADLLATDVSQIQKSMSAPTSTVWLDAPLSDDDPHSSNLLNVLTGDALPSTDAEIEQEDLRKEIMQALSTLSIRDQGILRRAFGIGCPEMTLEEISEHYHLTREHVRQIKDRAIRKLRTTKNKHLKAFI